MGGDLKWSYLVEELSEPFPRGCGQVPKFCDGTGKERDRESGIE